MNPHLWRDLQHFVMALAGMFWVWVVLTFVDWIALNSVEALRRYPWIREGGKQVFYGLWIFLICVGTFFLLKEILPW